MNESNDFAKHKKMTLIVTILAIVSIGLSCIFIGKDLIFKKNLPTEVKENLLPIIGLTENGYERLSSESREQLQLNGENWIDYSKNKLGALIILQEETSEGYLKDIDKEYINDIIARYAVNNNMVDYDTEEKNTNVYCNENATTCLPISIENYKKIAKIYNIENQEDKILIDKQIGKNYYYFKKDEVLQQINQIEDSLEYKEENGKKVIIYNIALTSGENKNYINKTVKYYFAKSDNNTYYLEKYSIENNNNKKKTESNPERKLITENNEGEDFYKIELDNEGNVYLNTDKYKDEKISSDVVKTVRVMHGQSDICLGNSAILMINKDQKLSGFNLDNLVCGESKEIKYFDKLNNLENIIDVYDEAEEHGENEPKSYKVYAKNSSEAIIDITQYFN